MYKHIRVLIYLLSISTSTAHAEHKLLITDVLAAKQFEIEADFTYARSSCDTVTKYPNWDPTNGTRIEDISLPGKRTRNFFGSIYSFGVGIGHELQLNAAIPFVFVDNIKLQDSYISRGLSTNNSKQNGVGDIAVGVKYGIYESKEQPLSIVTGLDVKFFTADSNRAGTGTNDIAPFIAASTIINGDLKPYASYRAIFRDHGAEDSHIVSTGAEYELNKSVILTPKLNAVFRTASDRATPYNTYLFGLSSYLNIFSNFYLIPHFNTGISTSASSKNKQMQFGTLRFVDTGLGIYYLFN